jgi:hypothetical protein
MKLVYILHFPYRLLIVFYPRSSGLVSMEIAQSYLPVEILNRIIWFTIPDRNYLAYPASHSTTKTLLAFLTVSRATSRAAKILLYTHCLYIDASWRLDSLLSTSLAKLDPPISLSRIQNLYLAPFPGHTIRDRRIVSQVTELFTLLSPSLKRLVINMPLRSHYPGDDAIEKLRPILRKGFEQLIHLEEFSSVKDELYLAWWDPEVTDVPNVQDDLNDDDGSEHWLNDFMFENWTQLRYLALYNCDLNDAFKLALASMSMLERVVLSRPDQGEESWFDETLPQVTLIESSDHISDVGIQRMTSGSQPPDGQLDAWKYKLFVDKEEDPISSVQDWSVEHMLDGSIWSLPDLVERGGENKIYAI